MNRQQLAQMFRAERAIFARHYPHVGRVGLALETRHFKRRPCARDLAWYESDTRTVVLLVRVLRLQLPIVRGLIRHELGHAADRNLYAPGAEQRADNLAERVTGRKIRYDARDRQTTGPGVYPRPEYLHR